MSIPHSLAIKSKYREKFDKPTTDTGIYLLIGVVVALILALPALGVYGLSLIFPDVTLSWDSYFGSIIAYVAFRLLGK